MLSFLQVVILRWLEKWVQIALYAGMAQLGPVRGVYNTWVSHGPG